MFVRKAYGYQRDNQNRKLKNESKDNDQIDKQRSTTQKAKDRVTRTPLKPEVNSSVLEW